MAQSQMRIIQAKRLGDEVEIKAWVNQRLVHLRHVPAAWYSEVHRTLELIGKTEEELEALGLEPIGLEHLDTFGPLGLEWN